MDKSEKIYRLATEMSKLIYDLGLNGWANGFTLENKKTKEIVEIRIKVDIKRKKNG